jgi:uncharacterized protein (DUF1697 family)
MPRYAAFLGSVNVGGNKVTMATLREAMGAAGFTRVATVVASGNVLFAHDDAPDDALAARIAALVEARFGFRTFAAVRDRDAVAAAIAANPFGQDGAANLVHTMLLDGPLEPAGFDRLVADHQGRERIAPGDRALFIDYVDGAGTSRLTKPFIERRIGRQGTARNLRSLARILAALDGDRP